MISRESGKFQDAPQATEVRIAGAGVTPLAQTTPPREVQAWGREIGTGKPRYIGELLRSQTGLACGLECPACGHPLTAHNAGRLDGKLRPHLKHPPGTQRHDCEIVAARLALVSCIEQDGFITLPQRSRSATAIGLSNTIYEAWRELPAQRVRIRRVDYSARARAILTLEDGRRLTVILTGSLEPSSGAIDAEDEALHAVISIDAGSASVAVCAMSLEELRGRLELIPPTFCWQSHWADRDLAAEAAAQAWKDAVDALDAYPDGWQQPAQAEGVTGHQSFLHQLVAQELTSIPSIRVPGWNHARMSGDFYLPDPVDDHHLALDDVRYETKLERRRPDLIARATGPIAELSLPLLAIEVVVTNAVTPDKLADLVEAGAAVLEIDLSRLGGRLSRAELRRLLVGDTGIKRWLHHPLSAMQAERLKQERELTAAWRELHRHRPVEDRPLAQLQLHQVPPLTKQQEELLAQRSTSYVEALTEYLVADEVPLPTDCSPSVILAKADRLAPLWSRVQLLSAQLADLGCPGGAQSDLLTLMSRLLSIRRDQGIGYRPTQGAKAVINHVCSSIKNRERPGKDGKRRGCPDAALCFIALKVYQPEHSRALPPASE